MKTNIDVSTMVDGISRNLIKSGFNPETISHAVVLVKNYKLQSVLVDGNFTVAIVSDNTGRDYVGVSKRNPKDRNNTYRGACIAASRAMANAILGVVNLEAE
jgi:hypothetical protein